MQKSKFVKHKLQRVAFTLLTLITPENCFLKFDLFSATKDKNFRLPTLCYQCYIMEVLNSNSKLTITALINQCVLLKSVFGYNMWFTFRLLLKSPFKKINQNDLDASFFEIIKEKNNVNFQLLFVATPMSIKNRTLFG